MQRKPQATATEAARHRRKRGRTPDGKLDADVAYARRVLDDPETEWIDWNQAKRELASKDD